MTEKNVATMEEMEKVSGGLEGAKFIDTNQNLPGHGWNEVYVNTQNPPGHGWNEVYVNTQDPPGHGWKEVYVKYLKEKGIKI